MKKSLFALAILVGVGGLAGCGEKAQPEFGDKKEDWGKQAPPPGWKGPGQGGGGGAAASGPISGPPPGQQ